jgi:hypothetical protein
MKPKTAADIRLSGLSTATLCRKASSPTAIPTEIMAQMATVSPKFQPEGVVSVDQIAAVTTVSMSTAKKV